MERQALLAGSFCRLSIGSPFVLTIIVAICAQTARADATGEAIYQKKCAACYGAHGEGGNKHKRPLQGDRSLAQLAELIGETMPEDDPGSLTPGEAAAVAAWVHDTFYSAIARERNRPARVELTRLTVRQYRQALADLIGSFRQSPNRSPNEADEQSAARRGLSGEYFSGRRFGRKDPEARRIDEQINFDYNTDSPVSEISEPHEFSIRWNGSLYAPETGEYEFVVRTDHAGGCGSMLRPVALCRSAILRIPSVPGGCGSMTRTCP
jgi:hypothetical protein